MTKVKAKWQQYGNLVRAHVGKELKVKLASGRYLNYGRIHVRTETKKVKIINPDTKEERTKIERNTIYSYSSASRGRVKLYGSRVFQNMVQADCRDILTIKMNAMDELGAKIVGTVHDEVIIEVPEADSLDKWKKIWDNAGKDKIKKIFGDMPVDSDCEFKTRYYK